MNLQSKTDEELNVMLAELMGWKMHDHPDCLAKKEGWASRDWKTWVMNPAGKLVMFTAIPRYCSFLDEVARVEAGLDGIAPMIYYQKLYEVVAPTSPLKGRDGFNHVSFKVATATARQRTLALISTLTKTP